MCIINFTYLLSAAHMSVIYLYIRSSVCPCLSVFLSVSVCVSVYLFVCLFLSVHSSAHPSVCLSVCLSVLCLSYFKNVKHRSVVKVCMLWVNDGAVWGQMSKVKVTMLHDANAMVTWEIKLFWNNFSVISHVTTSSLLSGGGSVCISEYTMLLDRLCCYIILGEI